MYELYADGACQPNPGDGGWAFILRDINNNTEFESSGSEKNTTNNCMELTAVIEGLKYFRHNFSATSISIILDSKYVLNGMSQWSHKWIKNGWKKRNGDPVLNKDLWQELLSLADGLNISFKHVKGHSGEKYNERCDKLATSAINELKG